jgi:hypothetical protein
VLYGTFEGASDGGTWHDIGRWHAWDNRWERCVAVSREGESFELYRKDGWVKAVYRRAPGNPEGY